MADVRPKRLWLASPFEQIAIWATVAFSTVALLAAIVAYYLVQVDNVELATLRHANQQQARELASQSALLLKIQRVLPSSK